MLAIPSNVQIVYPSLILLHKAIGPLVQIICIGFLLKLIDLIMAVLAKHPAVAHETLSEHYRSVSGTDSCGEFAILRVL